MYIQFGQRNNLSKVQYFTNPTEYFEVVFDPSNVIQEIALISDNLVSVTYKKEDEFAEVMQNTNPVIAAYTTAIARLKLYEYIEFLQYRVLYFDTDSVIYLTDLTNPEHKRVTTGWCLGEMTNELKDYGPDAYICEFASGGPKNYGYVVDGTIDGSKPTCIKVRGITLSNTTAKRVNFNTLKRLVHEFVKKGLQKEQNIVSYRIDVKRQDRMVVTRNTKKKFRVVYDKRIVKKDFTTIPYGWKY